MNKFIKLLFPFLFPLFFSCTESEDIELPMNHVVIVYMAADNDLSNDAILNLEQIKKGYSRTGNKLIVFMDTADDQPQLLEISSGQAVTLKEYPELNSVSPETFNTVLSDIIGLYPCEHYGLILWSHGTSWLPAGTYLRSFGDDGGLQMNIRELAEALPVKFDYILFDACLMGSVEVAYELKEKTDFVIASSTETIADGFPYVQIIPELLKTDYDLKKVVQSYFDYYNNKSGNYRSATISLIDTRELEKLATEINRLVKTGNPDLSEFERESVQRLDVYSEQYHFDLVDFIAKVFPDANKAAFMEQFQKVVTYKANTPQFLEMYDISTYCGLSCYIPHPYRSDLNEFYNSLKWAENTKIYSLFE